MIKSYSEYSHDTVFIATMMILIVVLVINLFQLKKIHENIKKKFNDDIFV